MMGFKQEAVGNFGRLSDDMQSAILNLMSIYHIRNGTKHNDGSTGEIRITPAEFKDLIASFIPDDGEDEVAPIEDYIIQ